MTNALQEENIYKINHKFAEYQLPCFHNIILRFTQGIEKWYSLGPVELSSYNDLYFISH